VGGKIRNGKEEIKRISFQRSKIGFQGKKDLEKRGLYF